MNNNLKTKVMEFLHEPVKTIGVYWDTTSEYRGVFLLINEYNQVKCRIGLNVVSKWGQEFILKDKETLKSVIAIENGLNGGNNMGVVMCLHEKTLPFAFNSIVDEGSEYNIELHVNNVIFFKEIVDDNFLDNDNDKFLDFIWNLIK